MKSVTHNGREFLFVEVPEDAGVFKISGTGWLCYKYRHTDISWKVLSQPNEDYAGYRILCKASEAGKELKVAELVTYLKGYGYRDYMNNDEIGTSTFEIWAIYHYRTATESLHSLILSLGMEVNRVIILEKVK